MNEPNNAVILLLPVIKSKERGSTHKKVNRNNQRVKKCVKRIVSRKLKFNVSHSSKLEVQAPLSYFIANSTNHDGLYTKADLIPS